MRENIRNADLLDLGESPLPQCQNEIPVIGNKFEKWVVAIFLFYFTARLMFFSREDYSKK